MQAYNWVSFGGVFMLLGIAWLFSSNRRKVNWRVLFWSVVLQLAFACFLFLVPAGHRIFLWLNDIIVRILESASAGTRFLFGRLALPPGQVNESGETSLGFFLAFQGIAAVVFFAALMGLLYHLRIMPWLIRGFAFVFTRLMRISGAESLCVSSNIFVGIESALTIRPHIEKMTRSELMTILTAGMATVASSVLAVYVFMLQDVFPTIAGHLVSASILSAPAALGMSKLMLPETESPETLGLHIEPEYTKEDNSILAVINGANAGIKLAAGISGLLLAFLGLVALADLLLGGFGTAVNRLLGLQFSWSMKNILGLLFYPFALIVGIPPADALPMAQIIGERLVVTELTAYQDLAAVLQQQILVHPRSAVICTYALCGFAHVASLAIFIGGIGALAPSRLKDLSRLGFRALLAATLACLMTAAVAGTFFNNSSILLR